MQLEEELENVEEELCRESSDWKVKCTLNEYINIKTYQSIEKEIKGKEPKNLLYYLDFFPVSFMMSVTTFMPIQILIQIQNCHIQF